MLTSQIDAALEAVAVCRARVPLLRELFALGSRERIALDGLIDALARADDALMGRPDALPAQPPSKAGFRNNS